MDFPSGEVVSSLPFTFRERKVKCDWQIFNLIDLDSVKHNKDIDTLKEHITAVTFCSLDDQCDHCQHPINSPLLKLTQMAQLSLEWVLHCYQHVSHSLNAEQKQLAAAIKKRDKLQEKNDKRKKIIEGNKKELAENDEELKKRRKIIYTQQQMLKPTTQSIKCPECSKYFISADYLRSHMQRVHPDKPQLEVLGEKPPDTVEIAPVETLTQDMKAFQDRVEQEQTNRDSERNKKVECLKRDYEHLQDTVAQLLKQLSSSDIVEETRRETIKQQVDNFKDWFRRDLKREILDREKKLQLEIDHLNDQVLLLQKELEASDSERESENKQAKLEVDKLEEQLHKEQQERIAQVENSKLELDNQKQLRTKAIKRLKNKLEIQWESRLQDLRTRLEAEKTQLLNKLLRMMEIEWRRQKMLYEEGVCPPSSKQHTCLSALRRIFKRGKKEPRAASTNEAVGQIVCENVIRMLVSLGAEPDQRGLHIGHDGKPDDRDQRQQIASIVQQVLDDQRSHAVLLSVPQEGPPSTTPLPEAPKSSATPKTDPACEEEEKGEEDRPQNTPERPKIKPRKRDLLETHSPSSVDDEEQEQEDRPPSSRKWSITSTGKARPDRNRKKEPPARGTRISPEKIRDQRGQSEKHAETPDDQHRHNKVASIVNSLIHEWFSDSSTSSATSSQSNEASKDLPPLHSVRPAAKPRKRASKVGTTTTTTRPETVAPANETHKSSPSPTIDSLGSDTTSVGSIASTSQTSQASQSPILMTQDSGAVKEEEEKEQEGRPQNKQTEAPVREKVSSNSHQATASAVGVISAAAVMKRKDEEEDSELKEPRPAPLQGPDQRCSVDKRNSGGESKISDVPTRAEKRSEKPPLGGLRIIPEEDYEELDPDLFSNIPNKRKEESPPAQGSDPMRDRLESDNLRWAASTENKSKASLSRAEKRGEKPPLGGLSIIPEEDYELFYQDSFSNMQNKRKEESPPAQGSDPMRAMLESDNLRWAASTGNKFSDAASRKEKQGEKPPEKKKEILGWDHSLDAALKDVLMRKSAAAQVSEAARVSEGARKKVTGSNLWGSQTSKSPMTENKSKAALSRADKRGEKPPLGGLSIIPEEDYEWFYQDSFSNMPNKRKEESPPAQGSDPMRAMLESDNLRWAASTGNKFSVSEGARKKVTGSNLWGSQTSKSPMTGNKGVDLIAKYSKQIEKQRGGLKIFPKR